MSVYAKDIPLVTKKSNRSGILFPTVGQYVGLPVDRNERLSSRSTFDNSVPFVVVRRPPHRESLLL